MSMAGKPRPFAITVVSALAALVLLSSCIVENPSIDTTGGVGESATPTTVSAPPTPGPPTPVPEFEPTVEPTAVVEPTPTTPPEPTPTPTPEIISPTPLPTVAPDALPEAFTPQPVAAGAVAIPISGTTFILATERPVLQLGGHTLVYLDDQLDGEVDIFTPAAGPDGVLFAGYGDLISFLETDPVFVGLEELAPVSIAGFPTRVFEGTAASTDPAFITNTAALDNNQFGWVPPVRMRLWVIDHPDQPIIVSAESLQDPGRYNESIRLATEILSTIDFG